MRRNLLLVVLLLAACSGDDGGGHGHGGPPPADPPPPQPPAGWVELTRVPQAVSSYDPTSLRADGDSVEALVRYDFRYGQYHEGNTYQTQASRVRLRCGARPRFAYLADTLLLGVAVVDAARVDSVVWDSVRDPTNPLTRWPQELCRRLAAPEAR